MKALVLYYSKTGSNKFLAEKIAQRLEADIEAIKPRLDIHPLLMLFSVLKTSPGINPLQHNIKDYDCIVLCGPVWMGKLIAPLRDVTKKYGNDIKSLSFATCCGSGEEEKDGRFGYVNVFAQVKSVMGDKCSVCEAFPIGLALPEDKRKDSSTIMNTRLSENNFPGSLQDRLEVFLNRIY